MIVQHVTQRSLERVRTFLDAHAETALFLASNLASYGPVLGESLNSGNFKYESLGFAQIGEFGLLFGSAPDGALA